MSKADLLLLLLFGIGGFVGYRRGFLLELFFLFALVLGVFVGFRLSGAGVDYLHKQFNADTIFLPYISFLIIFLLVVVVVSFFGRRLKNIVDASFLGKLDAAAGAVLGILKYMFCASVLIWIISAFHYSLPSQWTNDSWLYPVTTRFAPRMAALFSDFLPFFKEIFRQF